MTAPDAKRAPLLEIIQNRFQEIDDSAIRLAATTFLGLDNFRRKNRIGDLVQVCAAGKVISSTVTLKHSENVRVRQAFAVGSELLDRARGAFPARLVRATVLGGTAGRPVELAFYILRLDRNEKPFVFSTDGSLPKGARPLVGATLSAQEVAHSQVIARLRYDSAGSRQFEGILVAYSDASGAQQIVIAEASFGFTVT